MNVNGTPYRTVWLEGRTVRMINQQLLPYRFEIIGLAAHQDTAVAIKTMIVRGAGAIGAAAGYGMAQVVLEAPDGAGFGAYLANGAGGRLIPAYQVSPVDVTAAGDAFNGALAVAMAESREMTQAIAFANAAGALATTRAGSQPSLATRREVEDFLRNAVVVS